MIGSDTSTHPKVFSNKMSEFLWQECSKITKDFIEDKLAVFFVNPINDEFILSEYRAKIKKPMDLSTVFKKIKDNSYIGIQDWVDDIYLIFDNAIQFNGSDSLIGGIAAYFKKKFDKKVNILQLKNSRNLEDQLIKLQIKMLKLWSKQPPELLNEDENKAEEGDQTNQEIHVNEDIELLRKQQISSPLTTSELLGIHQNHILKLLSTPYDTLTISYPMTSLTGETLLPSSLYKQLTNMFTFQKLPALEFLPIEDFYVQGGQSPDKDTLNKHIAQYQATKNQPVQLPIDLAQNLYSSYLSVSQIETYNKCPFLYFIQYGLGVFPPQEQKLMPYNQLNLQLILFDELKVVHSR